LDSITPYCSQTESLVQLQRLSRFARTRNEEDLLRIQRYGLRQIETVRNLEIVPTGTWRLAYHRLHNLVLTVLERRVAAGRTDWPSYGPFLALSRFLAAQVPAETSQNARRFYNTLAMVASTVLSSPAEQQPTVYYSVSWSDPLELIVETIVTPMKIVTGYTLNAYEAFGCIFMTLPLLSANLTAQRFRDLLADSINYKLLANSLATLFKVSGLGTYPELSEASGQLRLLGCFIYFHRYAHNFRSPEAYSAHRDFVTVVSRLLNSLPNTVIDDSTEGADRANNSESSPFSSIANKFLQEQIMSLVNQESVGGLLSSPSLSAPGASEDDKVDEARQLANYALALLRFFPRRGDEIRMWLYLGPTNATSPTLGKKPAIRYFWEAAKRSTVFQTISRDSRAAIDLLKPKKVLSSPLGSVTWQAPSQAIQNAIQEDEWRVILVFLELYTFVLKVMDDEEFFSAGGMSSTTSSASTMTRDNALPLSEVGDLSTFLKNLGFTLYFNSNDINATDDQESSSTGLSFFNVRKTPEPEPEKKVETSVLGVAGLSMDYVKGLVTGLLRMVYERDSRRKFLSSDHWLMTSRFDMTGFIPAVVHEEESRHMIEEQDAEDVEEEDEEDFDDTPQLIGTSRTQQQRRLERLQRQQRKASRRRYLQAVAPRLEILQNMPFFIPFTTRVQIFREFVKLDMVRNALYD
jgi:ubiquitin-protein ligase E3 C